MLFNSIEFLLFLPIVFVLYWFVFDKKQMHQNFLLVSLRKLSCNLSDIKGLFVSESSAYRILKAKGLITSPAHILLLADDEFSHKPSFVHEMWQIDFTYFKILRWSWCYLSKVMDD